MKNSPKSIMLGWAGLAVCALGGYLGSKAYTNNRLRDYTANGGFGATSTANAKEEEMDSDGNKPLRRSVQRTL
ncbi:hypothetical protein BJV82DRAFT_672501 [Fennellomyces sp. T-0311]|nr:hypothetical protein BJV82DRAFT_672501 [Fennellomyces sp. T-0311]